MRRRRRELLIQQRANEGFFSPPLVRRSRHVEEHRRDLCAAHSHGNKDSRYRDASKGPILVVVVLNR
jgi:hypothetical protein